MNPTRLLHRTDIFDSEDPARHPAGKFVATALNHLAATSGDRRHDFHVIGLATISPDGAPRLRSVVLRGCNPADAEISFHTDSRSAKFAELEINPRASLLAYDASSRLQIRLEGRVSLHGHDADSEAIWRNMPATARRTYRGTAVPGQPRVTHALDDMIPETEAEAYFTVCRFRAETIDVLFLRSDGHRRAIGRRDPNGRLEACWVAA